MKTPPEFFQGLFYGDDGNWRDGSTSPEGRWHFVRAKGSPNQTMTDTRWLNKAIFGPDYEWAEIKNIPCKT